MEQRLVRLPFVRKAMKGEELAQQLMTSLSTEFGISSALLLGAIRDRASVNDVAVRHLKVLYPKLVDIGCFSHSLDHVWENMATPLLATFVKAWISLFTVQEQELVFRHIQAKGQRVVQLPVGGQI